MTKHAYVGCIADSEGKYRAHCKCGWVSAPFVQKKTAMKNLADHQTKGDARDAAAKKRARSKAAKKAVATRRRNAA